MNRCKIATNGEHEYTTSTTAGEVCKHCGQPRDGGIPSPMSQTADIPSPYYNPEEEICQDCGLPRALHDLEDEAKEDLILSNNPKPLEDYKQHKISDETYERILRETNSKSVMVITFAEELDGKVVMTKGFHINSVKINPVAVVPLLMFIIDALRGRLGGRGFKKVVDN